MDGKLNYLDCCFHSCSNISLIESRTSSPHITWVPQVLSSALLGGGCMVAFWQGLNYIIDCYGFYSNSAISVNTFIRSIAGAAFVCHALVVHLCFLITDKTHSRSLLMTCIRRLVLHGRHLFSVFSALPFCPFQSSSTSTARGYDKRVASPRLANVTIET